MSYPVFYLFLLHISLHPIFPDLASLVSLLPPYPCSVAEYSLLKDNFLHKGNYVFSTEAHPFSIDTVRRGGGAGAGAGGRRRSGDPSLNEDTIFIPDALEKEQERRGRRQEQGSHEQEDVSQRDAGSSPTPSPDVETTPSQRSPPKTRIADAPSGSDADDDNDGGERESDIRDGGAGESGGGRFGGGGYKFPTWSAWRASLGEVHHRLGPESWRDPKILLWAQVGSTSFVALGRLKESTGREARAYFARICE